MSTGTSRTSPWRRSLLLAVVVAASSAPEPAARAQAVEAADGARVIARVNGEALYAEDLESVLGELHRSQQIETRAAYDIDQLLFRLVNDTLLAQEARALGLHEQPEVQRRLAARRESRARARVYFEEVGQRLADVDEKAERDLYDDIFRVATLRLVTRRERDEVEALRPRVTAAADAASFAALAQEESQDPYRSREGRIEAPLASLFGSLIEFATTAAPGDVSAPIATPWGWSLFRLERLAPADPAQFEPRRMRVLAEVRHRQERALRLELVERLRPTLGLEVDWAIFESVGVRRMHDGRLLPQFDGPERVVARVAGRTIAVQDLAGKLASVWSNTSNPAMALDARRGVLDDLIFEELLVAEGLRRGYGDTPEVRRELHAIEVSQLASRFLREVAASDVEVAAEEAVAYYEANRERFRKPSRLHLLQLTVAERQEADRVAAQARGGADFAWLARRHSTDAYRDAGGDRGWFLSTEGIALFRSELVQARAGDVLGPKQGPTGWVVLKVDLAEDQGYYDYKSVSGNVESMIQGDRIAARIDSIITRLRERSEIWIDAAAVEALSIMPTAPEAGPAVPGHDGR